MYLYLFIYLLPSLAFWNGKAAFTGDWLEGHVLGLRQHWGIRGSVKLQQCRKSQEQTGEATVCPSMT